MLQQTQALRVVPKYQAFLRQFPTVQSLADAPLAAVLVAWNGLGYNRRAKYLHEAAKQLAASPEPWTVEDLEACKGIGHNTAAAVVTYAYNQPVVFIETNIRTIFIFHFFPDRDDVSDKEILPLVEEALHLVEGKEQPETWALPKPGAMRKTVGLSHYREWNWALMDYGVYLKRTVGNASRASKHYAKQSTFAGSRRQVRGQVLRLLGKGPQTAAQLAQSIDDERLEAVIQELVGETLIRQKSGLLHLGWDAYGKMATRGANTMKKHIQILGATLLVVPLVFADVVSAMEDMPSTTTPESSQQTTTEERVKARREAAKQKLTDMQATMIKNRCKQANTIIANAQRRIATFQTNRDDRYTKLVDKLDDFSARLKAAGIDTTEYDAQVKALDVLAQQFHTDVTQLKQAVDDLHDMDCTTDPAGFVATVKAAVELRQDVIAKGREFRTKLRTTIKPTLAAFKVDLQAKKTHEEQ